MLYKKQQSSYVLILFEINLKYNIIYKHYIIYNVIFKNFTKNKFLTITYYH